MPRQQGPTDAQWEVLQRFAEPGQVLTVYTDWPYRVRWAVGPQQSARRLQSPTLWALLARGYIVHQQVERDVHEYRITAVGRHALTLR